MIIQNLYLLCFQFSAYRFNEFRALVKFIPFKNLFLEFINLLTSPISALGVGLLFSLRLSKTKNKFFIIESFKMGIKQAFQYC